MAKISYSYQGAKEEKVRIIGRNLRISYKEAYEVANALRGMHIGRAKKYLENVIEKKAAVPYRRYNRGGTGHRKNIGPGRYPLKTSQSFLKVIKGLEANASFKGMDPEALVLFHIATHKSAPLRGRYKAGPHNTPVTHIEIVAGESQKKEVSK